jgi:hypothetical protein
VRPSVGPDGWVLCIWVVPEPAIAAAPPDEEAEGEHPAQCLGAVELALPQDRDGVGQPAAKRAGPRDLDVQPERQAPAQRPTALLGGKRSEVVGPQVA